LRGQSIALDEVMVSGNATWEGNALNKSNIEFKSKIKLPEKAFGVLALNFPVMAGAAL